MENKIVNQGIRQETFEKIFKEHLKIETYSKSIESLFSPRIKNKIDYKPYYQRNYVWDYNKATYFIESILLGTEIPPLIFFYNNSEIEIIDGRQRFETILRFMANKFVLKPKGLNILTQLKNYSYDDLAKNDREIIDKFLDAKLRIIEFKLVNEPRLDKYLEDRVKKEIFSRYNSGITPLKKAEIDNAIYDDDALSSVIKSYLDGNNLIAQKIFSLFFKSRSDNNENPPLENIMTFIRKSLVLPMTPITYYAQGTGRTNLLSKLYEKISEDSVNSEEETLNDLLIKIDFIKKISIESKSHNFDCNRLALECFLWALGILQLEDVKVIYDLKLAKEIAEFIHHNIESYTEQDYGFNKEVITRFLKTSEFLQSKFGIDTYVYVKPNDLKKAEIKDLVKPNDTATKLSELESLRLNKPEPSRISIDDVVRLMNKRRFLVRPSYQRKEVINPSKASSIIESILLGITLPAIFIFKKADGTSEVIDGQQRLLTLLGFIGSEYIDEKGKSKSSRNHKFSLRKLRILKELETKKFDQLTEEQKNKIYDFPLYLVEIDENQNPQFDPIDLFIRLNDKPYPIRENSFEMWNSWVDVDIIQNIKQQKENVESWFYLKQLRSANDRDRMENEELLTSLIFLEYSVLSKDTRKTLDVYQKTDRLNARIGDKILISNLLLDITEDGNTKKPIFEQAHKNIKSFIKKLKYILLDCDKSKDELFDYLRLEIDEIFKAEKSPKYFRRTMQDFYFLWYLVSDINFEMVKYHRIEIKKEIKKMFNYLKNIPKDDWKANKGMEKFTRDSTQFKNKYKLEQRKITLNEKEKLRLIQSQNNESNISGAPIFLGDDIEVDHELPISKGGKDEIENLKIVHKDENREKGSKT
jgi:5-methylcytosine-specific restriction endonuclease McrA